VNEVADIAQCEAGFDPARFEAGALEHFSDQPVQAFDGFLNLSNHSVMSRRRVAACLIGEVWVAGPHVAQGYWHNPEATNATFRAQIDGDAGGEWWLRTGDLGFLDETGELYITGRIKDLIIVRGINHYPQDIEKTVQDCHPALRPHSGAAFTVLDQNNEEQLVVVQEVERGWRRLAASGEIIACIREAITTEHDIAAHKIALIRTGTLPQTTSGKIQRNLTRQLWSAGALAIVE